MPREKKKRKWEEEDISDGSTGDDEEEGEEAPVRRAPPSSWQVSTSASRPPSMPSRSEGEGASAPRRSQRLCAKGGEEKVTEQSLAVAFYKSVTYDHSYGDDFSNPHNDHRRSLLARTRAEENLDRARKQRALNYLAEVLMPAGINTNCVALAFHSVNKTLYVGCNTAARDKILERLKSLKELIKLYNEKDSPSEDHDQAEKRYEAVKRLSTTRIEEARGTNRRGTVSLQRDRRVVRKASKNLDDEIKKLILDLKDQFQVDKPKVVTIENGIGKNFEIHFLDEGGEHAEMKVLQKFYSERIIPSYVGISKLCCALCERGMQAYFAVHGGGANIINFRAGTHGKNFAWEAPSFVKNGDGDYLKHFLGEEFYGRYNKLPESERTEFWEEIKDSTLVGKDKGQPMQNTGISDDSDSAPSDSEESGAPAVAAAASAPAGQRKRARSRGSESDPDWKEQKRQKRKIPPI